MLTVKDKEKRNYIYGYQNILTLTNLAASTWTQNARILNYPLKTNLCPKKIKAKIQCSVDFNIAGTTTGSGNYALQAMAQGFYITILGQRFYISPGNSEFTYEIDSHYWPTLQDFSNQPNQLVQINTNTGENPFFQSSGTGFFTALGSFVGVFIQLIITE